jgi:hypothetical protein
MIIKLVLYFYFVGNPFFMFSYIQFIQQSAIPVTTQHNKWKVVLE